MTAHKPTRTALRRELRNLARAFADGVVDLLDRHGMWEETLVEESDLGKRTRRTMDALQSVAELVMGDLRGRKQPVAISVIAEALGMDTREVAHPIHLLVSEGKVVQSGSRRGARYQLARRARKPKKGKKRGAKRR
jgi:hypothetical protein